MPNPGLSRIKEWFRWQVACALNWCEDTCWAELCGWAACPEAYHELCTLCAQHCEDGDPYCGKCADIGRIKDYPGENGRIGGPCRVIKGLRLYPFLMFLCKFHLCHGCDFPEKVGVRDA